MGTKNNPGRIDCYANAAPDEPIFVLRATDKGAFLTVRVWAEVYRARKQAIGEWGEGQTAKYLEALRCANDMELYYKEHFTRTSDTEPAAPMARAQKVYGHGEIHYGCTMGTQGYCEVCG